MIKLPSRFTRVPWFVQLWLPTMTIFESTMTPLVWQFSCTLTRLFLNPNFTSASFVGRAPSSSTSMTYVLEEVVRRQPRLDLGLRASEELLQHRPSIVRAQVRDDVPSARRPRPERR